MLLNSFYINYKQVYELVVIVDNTKRKECSNTEKIQKIKVLLLKCLRQQKITKTLYSFIIFLKVNNLFSI